MTNITTGKLTLVEATGGIHIGESFMKSFQASTPFGKIEIYEDKLILKIQYIPNIVLRFFEFFGKLPGMMGACKKIPRKIHLQYNEISGYKEKDLKIAGYGITLIHTNNQYPPFLQVWISKRKAKEIISYLNNKGISKAI